MVKSIQIINTGFYSSEAMNFFHRARPCASYYDFIVRLDAFRSHDGEILLNVVLKTKTTVPSDQVLFAFWKDFTENVFLYDKNDKMMIAVFAKNLAEQNNFDVERFKTINRVCNKSFNVLNPLKLSSFDKERVRLVGKSWNPIQKEAIKTLEKNRDSAIDHADSEIKRIEAECDRKILEIEEAKNKQINEMIDQYCKMLGFKTTDKKIRNEIREEFYRTKCK